MANNGKDYSWLGLTVLLVIIMLTVVIPFGFLILVSISSINSDKMSQVTHDRFEAMEEYVYDNVGSKIYFLGPKVDRENKLAIINLTQSESNYDPVRFEEARCLINDYMRDHSDFFLNDGYMIKLVYLKHYHHFGASDGDEEIGYSTNYFNYEGETQRGYIEISNVYDSISVINFTTREYSYGFYPKLLYDSPDVKVVNIAAIDYDPDYDDMTGIFVRLTDLDYVVLDYWEGDVEELEEDMRLIDQETQLLVREQQSQG